MFWFVRYPKKGQYMLTLVDIGHVTCELFQISKAVYRNCVFLKELSSAIRLTFSMRQLPTLPYFCKREQVTYHLNLSYCCFHTLPSVLFFRVKLYASTLILLRDMYSKISWYSIDVRGNDRHMLLFYKICHFLSLASFCQSWAELIQERIQE